MPYVTQYGAVDLEGRTPTSLLQPAEKDKGDTERHGCRSTALSRGFGVLRHRPAHECCD